MEKNKEHQKPMENKPPLKIYISKNSAKSLSEKEYVWDCNASAKVIDEGVWKIDIPYILESEHEKILNELRLKMEGIRLSAVEKYKDNKHRPLSEACIEAESCIDVINELIRELNLLTTK